MQVTGLVKQGKGKVLVRLDGRNAFTLYRAELIKYGIAEDGELSETEYDRICEEVLTKRALNRCLYLLNDRDYTVSLLREKLMSAWYPKKTVAEVLKRLEEYGYVNDKEYARRYMQCRHKERSRRQVLQELARKGISREITDEVMEEFPENCEAEREKIKQLLIKRHFDPEIADRKERQKQFAYLSGKGFRGADIIACMESGSAWICDDCHIN